MIKHTVMAAAISAAFGFASVMSSSALAADDKELVQIRAEIRQIKDSYEARLQALEAKLQQATEQITATATTQNIQAAPAPATQPAAAGGNTFNPAVSLILGGTYTNLSQDPKQYRIQGFIPGGEVGPGARSFNLGESELSLAANVDPNFSGKLTFALASDNTVSVEEAFAATTGLSNGINLKAGRFLSSIGYLNNQHAHAWDFVDAPLAYQALFGGQYKTDGVQARWLAPTERFLELGLELGNGAAFPGNDRNKNGFGSTAIFAHLGDDIGDSASWRIGLSHLQSAAQDRTYDDINSLGQPASYAFSGKSSIWIVDGIYKWAPNGNATHTNLKLQGEYFQRKESGSLASDASSGGYASNQSGGYVQGIYQFAPAWRVGLRYDRLSSGSPDIGLINNGMLAADFSRLAPYNARRNSVMLDFNPSEFSRIRLQFARDLSRPEAIDNQFFLQYIMSLGAHGAHSF